MALELTPGIYLFLTTLTSSLTRVSREKSRNWTYSHTSTYRSMFSILHARSEIMTNANTGITSIVPIHTKFLSSTKVTIVGLENAYALYLRIKL